MDRGKTCNFVLEGIFDLCGRTDRERTVQKSEGKPGYPPSAGDVVFKKNVSFVFILSHTAVRRWKDIMHVYAAISFHAEALDVELAGQFDEIVVALHMFQLTLVTLKRVG